MNVETTPIEGLLVVTPQVFGDDRGSFYESFNADKLAPFGIPELFRQDNFSSSIKGVLRGIHFQLPPKPMGKFVRVTRGKVWDVAVDLRKNSPTYKQWFGIELSAENKKMFWVPEGFGHGFYALEDCDFVYKCTNTFDKAGDANIAWNDPDLNIQWPLQGEPILSARDQVAPMLKDLNLPF